MKKILFLLPAAVLMFVSCEGPAGPPGEKGEPGLWWFVNEYTVRSDQWKLVGGTDELNSYYQYEIPVPELDKDVFYEGKMTCYMYLNEDYSVQAELPEVIHYGEYNPDTGGENLWTETYKCDYAIGSILFKVEYSDFFTGNRPGTKRFRVVLNY
ncbi:MAG: hypothetical protein LBP98_09265 [Tannerella sp.]|nr:hypothetical protein [Tannerella sp.]